MARFNTGSMKQVRRLLRNNQTKWEELLWERLRKKKLGYVFHRQYSVSGFVLDFYCPAKRLAIELDGNRHSIDERKEYDAQRTEVLKGLNIQVIRFWDGDVEENIDLVIEKISMNLENRGGNFLAKGVSNRQ